MTPTPPRADRTRGTRVRAGNAMDRTEAAIVTGVGACLAAHGAQRTTMIDIAAAAGIAKGTLYNHVRTKSEAFSLFADAEVARLLDLLGGPDDPIGVDGRGGVTAALGSAAAAISGHPAVARMRAEEPAALASLLLLAGSVRPRVVEALEDLVGPELAPTAWRWLLSLLVDPGDEAERRLGVEQLAIGVPTA